jgi:hypothetical protein
MIPRAVVYALTNIDRDMPKTELLKLLSKDSMVRYAAEFGIRGKSLTKPVLLDRIVAASIARNMPVVAQAIEAESAVIADEIVTRVSERVDATGEQPPNEEEIQAVVEQRISTGEAVSPAAVAAEIVAEQQIEAAEQQQSEAAEQQQSEAAEQQQSEAAEQQQSEAAEQQQSEAAEQPFLSSLSSQSSRSSLSSQSSLSSKPSSRSSRSSLSSQPSSRSSRSTLSSQPSSRSSRSTLSSQPSSRSSRSTLSSQSSRSSQSSSSMSSVASSVSIARSISSKVADDIVDEVEDSTDRSSVKRTIDEVIEEQGVNLDIDPNRLEEIVSDEQAREAVESVVARAAEEGLISEDEGEEILQPLRDEAGIPGPSGLGARPKVPSPARRPPPPVRRRIRGERDIETLLREIQKPEESISNMPVIKHRVFRCLGLVN